MFRYLNDRDCQRSLGDRGSGRIIAPWVSCCLAFGTGSFALHAEVHADKHANVTLSLATYSSEPSVGFADADASVRIEAIWMTMQDLRFREASVCNRSAVPIAIPGPITAELVRRRVTGLADAKLVVARYCAFELAFRKSRGKADGATADLRGASIVILGKRRDGVRFVLRCRLDTAPRLRAHDLEGFAVSGSPRFILAADVGRWMTGLDLSTAVVEGDGGRQEIRIDDKTNPELLTTFRGNVEAGLGLFGDADGDNVLDEVERTQPIASGAAIRR